MSLRRSLTPNQKFSIILASIAVLLAAETGGLFVLSQQYPPPRIASLPPVGSETPSSETPGSTSSDPTQATKPSSLPPSAPVFTAPGVQPPAPNTPTGSPAAGYSAAGNPQGGNPQMGNPSGGFVAPPPPGNAPGGIPGTPGSNPPPSIIPSAGLSSGGKNDLTGKPGAKETPEKAKAREAFARGVEALKKNDGKTAIDAFEQVVALVPTNLPSHLNLASLYLGSNQPKKALSHLVSAAHLDPKSAAVRFNIARTQLALGRPKEALAALKETVHLAPDERDGRLLLGQVLLQTRQPKDAYDQFKHLAQRDKRDVEAHVMAATIAAEALRQPKEAERWLRRSIEAEPRAPQAAMMLGRLLLAQGKFKDAEKVLTTATRARPDVFDFYPLLANARSANGDVKGAVSAIESAIMRLPVGKNADEKKRIAFAEGGLRITLGQTLGNAKKIKEALVEFEKAAKLRPNDPTPRSLGAIASLQLKDAAKATRLLQSALKLDPKRLTDRKMLAQLYVDSKRWKDADAQLALYSRARPRDIEALGLWAQVARVAKDGKREKQVVKQMTEVAPKNPLGWAQLGILQREAGEKKAALATFTKLAALTPSDPSPPFEMARLQSELGDFDAAFRSWQKVIRNKPEYAPSYSSLLQAGDEAKERGPARAFLVRQLSGRAENVDAIKEILRFYDGKKRPDEAKAFLNDLVARNPKFLTAKAALDSYSPAKPDTEPTKEAPAKNTKDTTPNAPKPEE